MPTLEWIGKGKVVNHHLEVPYRVLTEDVSAAAPPGLSAVVEKQDKKRSVRAIHSAGTWDTSSNSYKAASN